MRGLIALFTAALLSFGGQALATDKQKVAYHINGGDAQQQAAALGNVRNHINAMGADKLDIKVVMHGDGLSLVLLPEHQDKTKMKTANADQNMQARIDGLKMDGVQFQVCANTLKGRNIPKEALYDFKEDDVVPSGVAQLSILQEQGYTYIKP
ncbi:MAG: DsrE family protein [Gammaproteobacteria bacterium]|nr:DsrE family protein [Gammaproteobacteria bacterium]